MAASRRLRVTRALLALMGCLPAAVARAHEVGGDAESLAEPAIILILAGAAGAFFGWRSAREATRSPATTRSRRDRWLAALLTTLLVTSTVITVLTATTREASWWASLLLALPNVALGSGFLLAHAARLARDSPRSWWPAEVGALAGVVALTLALGWDLGGGAWALASIAGATAILSLLAASIAAFRADAATAARAHGRTLRIALVLSAAVVTSVGVRLRMIGPRDLDRSDVTAWPSGEWVGVWGRARWPASFEPDYLLNVQTGRWIRHGAWISADGRIAAWWPESEDDERPRPVFVRSLHSPGLKQRRLRSVRADVRGFLLLLSQSGRFLLVHEQGQLVVVDVEADRVTKRLEDVPGPGSRHWRLDDSGRVRLLFGPRETWELPSHRVEIHDEDPKHQGLRVSAVIEAPADMIDARADWTTFLGDERLRVGWRGLDQHRRLTLHDARDGRQLAVLADGDRDTPMTLMSLADGRLVHPGAGHDTLEVLSPDGVLERVVEVPRASSETWFVGEESPGRIVIHTEDRSGRRVMLVDVDHGEVCAVASDLEPVDRASDVDYRVGSLATRLFRGTSRSNYRQLIELDWATGTRRVVLPR
jgi:hypothetical protein